MRNRFFTPLVCLLIAIFCLSAQFTGAETENQKAVSSSGGQSALTPVVDRSVKNDTTIPLRDMKPLPIKQGQAEAESHEVRNRVLPKALNSIGKSGPTSLLTKNAPATKTMPGTFENFEGTDNLCGCLPPDTNGDVGPDHYVQTVNNQIQVFDKHGNSVLGPEPINTLWGGFGGACEVQNNGDPIALYDQLADRWLISQFALFAAGGHNHQCVAISQTGDPTGAYYRYDFDLGTLVNDYPHLGVWPDGYYMTVNQFTGSFAWAGAGVYAFERDKMLLGQSAQKVYFNLFSVDSNFGGMLPSDLDGPAPVAGTPNVFAEVDDDAFGVATDRLSLWNFHVDWTAPTTNSTFGISGQPNTHVDTAPFDANMCNFLRSCIDQPGTGQGLDAISDRLMHRLQYRTFGGYATLVGNHTVDADGTDHAGVDWFSLRNDGSGWAMNDEGIYAPDSDSRWMGSAAMDSAGNIAIGYSVSGAGTFPSIRYAGRLSSDPAGEMSQGEGTIIAGTGNQTHSAARWGDYSGIAVDPSPGNYGGIDCDFWYTTEYIATSGSANWQTRIGAFSFAPGACGGPHGDLDGTITDSSTTDPIAGAKVQVQPGGFSTTTDVNGHYHMTLSAVPGLYDVTASSYGYFSQTHNGIQVTDGGTTIEDFDLGPAPHVNVSGTVTDGSGHGWPLYARIDIAGYPLGSVYTDPFSGTYSVELIQDTPYTFSVHAISGGYNTGVRPVTPPAGGSTENFALTIDTNTCDAPGYGVTSGLFERFNSGSTPSGWTVVDNMNNGEEWTFTDPENQPNNTGGSGLFAVINSDFYGPDGEQDTELRSPVLDFSSQSTVHVEFDTDFHYYGFPPEVGDVDVSSDGGSTWTNVLTYQDQDTRGPHHEDLDVSSLAGNQASVMVRFHYYNAIYEWWWQVDNVKIGATCGILPGGLIAGNVYDGNTNLGLNGAKVASDNAPSDKTTAFSTLFDPNVDEGFYILFSSLAGTNPFTGSKNSYGSDTQPVNVTANQVVQQDFHLAAGNIVPDPLLLEDTVDLGTTDAVGLTLNNTGGAAANFELQEGNGNANGPQPNAKGAPLINIKGHFSPLGFGAKTRQTKLVVNDADKDADVVKPVSPKAPPWTDIANYPSSIMDNTCAEIDGKIYCVGGTDGSSTSNASEVYDPGANSWASIAAMAAVREKPAVAAIDGKLYVTGGWDSSGSPDATLEIYDPAGDSWSTGASIPTPYAASTGVNLDGKFYVIGGCDQTCGVTDVQVYDPAGDSWSTVAAYPEPISWEACGAGGGLIYCAGGVADSESQHTYSYDPGSDAWTQLADMSQTQWAMGYTISDDQLYISGGVTDNFNTVTNAGFVYDPGADSWTAIENSNNTLYRGGSACGLYKIGGSSGGFNPVPDSEVYPGLTNCGGVIDMPWLSEVPTSGTVLANDDQGISVTFDAAQVTQPGDYLAHLRIRENTPYTTPDVQVIMHVPLPDDWGYLTGTVTGMLRCDLPGNPLKKATVVVDTGGTDYTLKTGANGKYLVAFPVADGPVTITASMNGYVTKFVSGVTIDHNNTTTQDFDLRLDAACIDVQPQLLETTVNLLDPPTSALLQFNLTNTGAAAAGFELKEGNGNTAAPQFGLNGKLILAPPAKHGSLNSSIQRLSIPYPMASAPNMNAQTTKGLQLALPHKSVPYPKAVGNVIQSWTPSSPSWGIAVDAGTDNVWADSPAPAWGGNNKIYEYQPNGTATGTSWSHTWNPANGPADATFNPNTGTLWSLDVGGDNCIHEIDPASGVTGNKICPAFPISQRGVAYDPETDTYYAGGWNDFTIYHFDSLGAILDSQDVGLAISGLAFNPDTQHLFVMVNDSPNTIHVLDVASAYADLGDFAVSGFNDFDGAGLEIGCDGSLWAVNQGVNKVYQIDSGESTSVCGQDVPWLSENPTNGTLAADQVFPGETIDVTFDATQVTQPGDYFAHIKVKTSYKVDDVQAKMHVPLPTGWGYLEGTVKGDLRCDLPGNPLKNATVFVDTLSGTDWTLHTDASGHYVVAYDASTGPASITVSKNGYIQQVRSGVEIDPGELGTNPAEDFNLRLDAPCLDVQPQLLEAEVNLFDPPTSATLQFSLTNTGAGAANFELKEGGGHTNAPQLKTKAVPKMRFTKMRHGSSKNAAPLVSKSPTPTSNARSTKGLSLPSSRTSIPYPKAAGDVIQSWSPSSTSWGIAVDAGSENVWVDSPSPGWGGDDNIYEYQSDGTATGTNWPHTWNPSNGPADATFNQNTGTVWSLDVGGDDCIHEIDPASGVTGNTVCPPWSISQRGIAYDPETDTYYGGGWNDFTIYHFDSSGAMLDSQDVGLAISGLAFNPDTQHLFVMVNDSPNTIHVLDVANGYADLGDIAVSGFNDFDGAGLEIGCDGSLWAVNQGSNEVFQIDSGESTSICGGDLPWLSESPESGAVAADIGVEPIDVTFDGTQVNQPGYYLGHIKVKTSYTVPDVQVTMHVPLPTDWGYLEGTVTGMARCDQPGNPLNKATVFVDTGNTTYTLKTDTNGHYLVAFPIADGPTTTITASAKHYVTQMTAGVVLDHDTHAVLDFDLRLDAPCADKSPTSFAVDLGTGASTTLPLTLNNTGAGALNFELRETYFQLIPQRPNLRKATVPAKATANAATPGASSVLSLKQQKGASRMPVPSNAWFMALPVPDGLVRYAHAQCDIQPNSFYVITGVDGTFSSTTNTWRFDALTNTWNALAPIPLAAEGATATCYQGRIYVMGGSSDGYNGGTQFYVYDITTNTWLSAADLPRQVWGAGAGAWNGQVYLIGGNLDFFGSGTSAEVDIYDIASDTWTGTGTDMPVATAAAGFVQAGNDLYIVGGWDDSTAPDVNNVATQRYDMSDDTWTTGPDLLSGRADLALAITDTALYAMGGDDDGNSFFDPTDGVSRLEWAGWPGGAWTDVAPGIPVAYTSNSAGFCTQAIAAGSEVWSLGGLSLDFTIDGTNTFRPSQTEHCYTIFTDVLWLSESPVSGTVDPDSNGTVNVTFDTTGLASGDYNAVLVVSTNDFGATQFNIPVTLHVGLFHDDFDDGDFTTPAWTVTGPTGSWDASSGDLVGTASKKVNAISPAFGTGGCTNCTIIANMTANTNGEALSLFGWRADKKNYAEVRLKIGLGKVLFIQKAAGTTVAKHSEAFTLPTGDYTVQASFDGTDFNIQITQGGNTLNFSVPAAVTPKGTLSFRVKAGAGTAKGTLKDVTVF
jgi:N-acetylneuraminic acid mutarotase